MKDTNIVFEEFAIEPKFLFLMAVFFCVALLSGTIYDVSQMSVIGLASDGLFIVAITISLLLVKLKKVGYFLPLAVALYTGVFSFTLDIITSIIDKEPFVLTKVPIDIALIIICNLGLGLFLPRIITIFNGILTSVLFIFFTIKMNEEYLWRYNLLVQPTMVGCVIMQTHFRKVVSRMLIKLYGEKYDRPILDLKKIGITQAEYVCINFLCAGYTTKEIAAHEKCTDSAIQARMGQIYVKVNVPDRSMLMYVLGRHRIVWSEA